MARAGDSMAALRAGVVAGQTDAVETVRGWIAAMVYGAGWRISDPESAIQDVTARVIQLGQAGRIREKTDFKSFVLTIARHACTDVFRRERLQARYETTTADPESVTASAAGDPQAALERKERRDALRFIFQALPEECRRLWRWVYGQGLAATEVAERLGISTVNVRVRVHRCLKRAQAIRGDLYDAAGLSGTSDAP